jgi:hypothetical protein
MLPTSLDMMHLVGLADLRALAQHGPRPRTGQAWQAWTNGGPGPTETNRPQGQGRSAQHRDQPGQILMAAPARTLPCDRSGPSPPHTRPPRPDHGGLSASQRPHDHGRADPSRAGPHPPRPDRPGHAAQPTPRPAPTPTPTGPVAGDHRRPWPARTLAQARNSRTTSMPATSRSCCRPSSVSTVHAQAELGLFARMWSGWVRPPARSAPTTASGRHLYLAQPVRHDNGVWVVTRVGDPVGE